MASVLITGGAGFVGANLLKRLATEGHHVTVVDNLRSGKLDFIHDTLKAYPNTLRFINASFDHPVIRCDIVNERYNTVIHLAAIPRIGFSIENPVLTHETNIDATLNLIEACRNSSVKFIFASSSSIYGNAKLPAVETAYPDIKSPYALQKHTVEQYLKLYSDLYGLNAIALRFFSVFGPYSLGTAQYSTVVGAWLTAYKQGKSGILHGDGTQARDFCYVDNVVDAIVAALDHDKHFQGDVVNIACGETTSLNLVAELLQKQKPDFSIQKIERRTADIDVTLADITQAQKLLGYKPKISFAEGLDLTIKWYDNNWSWIEKL